MSETYFEWLNRETPFRAWVNNPTEDEIGLALENGAVGCTCNPAYCGNLLKRAPEEILPDIREIAHTGARGDEAVALVQQRAIARILPHFLEIYERSGGREGWVSLQGAPELDFAVEPIVESARLARSMAPNCIPKVPATGPGLEALDVLVRENEPVLMTEVFSLAQVAETCERYVRASESSGHSPVFIMAPITGILGDHLKSVAQSKSMDIQPEALKWAGVIWAREAKRLVDQRGYPVQLLYGGARTTADITGLVGGPHAATINWSTFSEVLEIDPERRVTGDDPAPTQVREELSVAFDDFRRAISLPGVEVDEFESFGPVQHFRDSFIAGWNAVREAIDSERVAAVGS